MMNLACGEGGYTRLNCNSGGGWILDAMKDMSSVHDTLSGNLGWSGKDVLSDTQHCWCLIHLYRPLEMRPVRRNWADELKRWRQQRASIYNSITKYMATLDTCFENSLNNE